MHQYLFDAYRAARLGEPAPPEPGTHDVAVLRALRERRRAEREPGRGRERAGRPARGTLRHRLRTVPGLRTAPGFRTIHSLRTALRSGKALRRR